MADTSVRVAARRWLVNRLRQQHQLAGVTISETFPGKALELQHVWVDRITGTVTYPVATAGRQHRQDDFTLTVALMAGSDGDDLDVTDALVETYFTGLEDILADRADLDDEVPEILHALVGPTVDGPDGELTNTGAVSFVRADVTFTARLT